MVRLTWYQPKQRFQLMIFAYIDPALGSMLLQAIAGVMIAMVVMGRRILLKPLEWLNLSASHMTIIHPNRRLKKIPSNTLLRFRKLRIAWWGATRDVEST